MIFKIILSVSVSYVIPYMLLDYFLKRKELKNKNLPVTELSVPDKSETDSFYQCMFVGMKNFNCRQHVFDRDECCDKCSQVYISTICNFLTSADTSISMCMYTATLRQICDQLFYAKKRGVKVRIITDYTMNQIDSSRFKYLNEKYGFAVRCPRYEESFMHHKFCLIDEKVQGAAKMFMGSLNLTLQGCTGNFEHCVFTNNTDMIKRYSEEFELLWKEFDPVKQMRMVNPRLM